MRRPSSTTHKGERASTTIEKLLGKFVFEISSVQFPKILSIFFFQKKMEFMIAFRTFFRVVIYNLELRNWDPDNTH